jgi:hypothetical protein
MLFDSAITVLLSSILGGTVRSDRLQAIPRPAAVTGDGLLPTARPLIARLRTIVRGSSPPMGCWPLLSMPIWLLPPHWLPIHGRRDRRDGKEPEMSETLGDGDPPNRGDVLPRGNAGFYPTHRMSICGIRLRSRAVVAVVGLKTPRQRRGIWLGEWLLDEEELRAANRRH